MWFSSQHAQQWTEKQLRDEIWQIDTRCQSQHLQCTVMVQICWPFTSDQGWGGCRSLSQRALSERQEYTVDRSPGHRKAAYVTQWKHERSKSPPAIVLMKHSMSPKDTCLLWLVTMYLLRLYNLMISHDSVLWATRSPAVSGSGAFEAWNLADKQRVTDTAWAGFRITSLLLV